MRLTERAYLKLTAAAPERLAARIDLRRPAYFAAAPLNGQLERQGIVRELASTIAFDRVVETGTFRAATTLFLAHAIGVPVHSVELRPRYFKFARRRCAEEPEIHLTRGDSRAFLRSLSHEIADATTFFYLDAHWESDVPRFEELEIISGTWDRAVVMIDDFQVPDDPGYGFVHYGETPLTVDYLPEMTGWSRWFPSTAAARETGASRGCIVLASGALREQVSTLRSVRRA
jgi:hypothetical protein